MGKGDLSEAASQGFDIEDAMESAAAEARMLPQATDTAAWKRLAVAGRAVIETIVRADPATSVTLLDTLISSEEQLIQVAAAWRLDFLFVKSKMTTISTRKGCKSRATNILSIVRTSADQYSRAAEEEQREAKSKAMSTLKCDIMTPGLRVPPEYEVSRDGIIKVVHNKNGESRSTLAHRPIWVNRRFQDISDDTTRIELVWRSKNRWIRRTVPRTIFGDTKELSALAKDDAPIDITNSTELVRFLTAFEATNENTIPCDEVASSMGWQDNSFSVFIVGNTVIQQGDRKISLVPKGDLGPFCDAWHPKGDLDGWYAMVRSLRQHPAAFLSIYAALASTLLEIVDVQNHMYEFAGETTGGKTLSMRIGASVWGEPMEDKALLSWNQTRVGFEHNAVFSGNIPLFCDDTAKAARKDPETIAKIVYDHSAGQGRARGTTSNTLIRGGAWRSIMISTGETPIFSLTSDGGTRARVISFVGYPFGRSRTQAELSEKKAFLATVDTALHSHYGHFGPVFIRYILNTPGGIEAVKHLFHDRAEIWRALADSSVLGRLSQYVALLDTTKWVAEQAGLPAPEADVMGYVWKAAQRTAMEANVPESMLGSFLDFCVSSAHRFWGKHQYDDRNEPKIPSQGWFGAWKNGEDDQPYIYVIPTVLVDYLKERKTFKDAMFEAWMERGFMEKDPKKHTPCLYKVNINHVPTPCYRFSASLIESMSC